MLLTPKILKPIRESFQSSTTTCIHPYKWDERRNCPKITQSPQRLRVWYLNVVYCMFYWGCWFGHCVQVTLSDDHKAGFKVLFQLMVVFMGVLPMFQLTFVLHTWDYPQLVRGFLENCEYFEKGKQSFKDFRCLDYYGMIFTQIS